MKKQILQAVGLILMATLIGVAMAEVPFLKTLTIADTSGSITNTRNYKAEQLLYVEVFDADAATGTVTITKVRNSRTNTVGTITLADNYGRYTHDNSVTPIWFFKGDVMTFTHSGGATASTVEVVGALGD